MDRVIEQRGNITINRPAHHRRRTPVLVGGKPAPEAPANIYTYGNIWVREINFREAGMVKSGHRHKFDHLHFLAKGRVKLRVYDADHKLLLEAEKEAPAWIKVPKEHYHDIVALEDGTLGYCIQAVRNEHGEVVDTDFTRDFMDEVKAFEAENGRPDEEVME